MAEYGWEWRLQVIFVSFGGSGGPGSFGFGLNDIFSNFFGGDSKGGVQFGGSTRSQSGPRSSSKNIRTINSQVFQKEITAQGMTWLLLSYTSSLKGNQHIESILEEVASTPQELYRYSCVFLCSLAFDFPLIGVCLFCFSLLTGWKHKLCL